jgi:Domain of unknown function (DUF4383)
MAMRDKPKYMAVQGAALIVGGALILLGVLGFIPGITTDYDRLEWTGSQSAAKLFGVFVTSGAHNIVHLAVGVLGLIMARSYAAARAYFLGGGLVYLALWVHGQVVDHGTWLHFGLGVAMVILGLTLAGQRDPTKRRRRVRAAPT